MANGGQQVTAFYDESGVFTPGQDPCVSIGMVVVASHSIRELSVTWWEMVGQHFPSIPIPATLPLLGIEAKVSDLRDMAERLRKHNHLKTSQSNMFKHGLDSLDKIDSLIKGIYNFVSNPVVHIKYLAACGQKEEYWQSYFKDKIYKWKYLIQTKDTSGSSKTIGKELSQSLLRIMYEWLLQRLQFLSSDPGYEFTDSFVVGDETSNYKTLLTKQSVVQAGFGKHSDIPTVVNKSWFGSSLHEPCLQIADSIAYAVKYWAEGRGIHYLKNILPNFRGYPDRVKSQGSACCPNKECFPSIE